MKSLRVGSRPGAGSISTSAASTTKGGWSRAATKMKSALPASATAIFVPVSDEPCGSRETPRGSCPWPSSHSATVPRFSPAASGRRYCSRCSGVPAAARSRPAQALEKNGVRRHA